MTRLRPAPMEAGLSGSVTSAVVLILLANLAPDDDFHPVHYRCVALASASSALCTLCTGLGQGYARTMFQESSDHLKRWSRLCRTVLMEALSRMQVMDPDVFVKFCERGFRLAWSGIPERERPQKGNRTQASDHTDPRPAVACS